MDLGRIEICLEVYLISSNLVLPQEVHLEQPYHMFVCLNKHHNYELVINPSDQYIYQSEFERQYRTSRKFVHVSGKEDLPPNMPDTHGLGFVFT